MARYTCLFTISVSVDNLQRLLNDTLKSCNLDVIYATASGDYMMARELPGQVAYNKLVTVEVLIDKATTTDKNVRLNCVIKNEELPLRVNNHCHSVFNCISEAISTNQNWRLIESMTG